MKSIDFYINHRREANRDFIRREQQKPYRIEGNLLDPQQIEAVVACDDAELILAPAGSGKSASLMAKVNYIIDHLGVPPDEVLIIAFTRKVVDELKDRIRDASVEICTFHSLGNKIIKGTSTYGHKELIQDGLTEQIISSSLQNLHLTDEDLSMFDGLDKLAELMITTLGLQKNEQITLAELKSRFSSIEDKAERAKSLKFFNWYQQVYESYEQYLNTHGLYDFADMLELSKDIVLHMSPGELPYKYILVDEVQDLSRSKYLLLRAILDNCKNVKLFAVGDDWQSIYRFAGSNLGVLADFEQIFGRVTYRSLIELTYRFGEPTAWISGNFIQKNPHQSKKRVRTFRKTKTPISVSLNPCKKKSTPRDYEIVNSWIQQLYHQHGDKLFTKRLQVISRYNHDLYRLITEESMSYKNAAASGTAEEGIILKWRLEGSDTSPPKTVDVAFCSMHKSKGITRDIVFVINMNNGAQGMPATRADNAISSVLLAKLDPYPLAEERRLFYVAITRAVEHTILISEIGHISDYVFEIAPFLDSETAELLAEQKKRQRLQDKKARRNAKSFLKRKHQAH